MAAKKKKPETKGVGASGSTRSMRAAAEKKLTDSKKISPDLTGQPPEELIHELRVHQIELEMQAEELRRAHLALEESRDKYLDLYEFAPIGYITLTDKGIITNVNLTGATLLGVERSRLVRARFRKFIAPHDLDTWDQYFMSVLQHEKTPPVTLLLKRGDDSVFPIRLESIRLSGKSDGTTIVRVAISDITDIRQAEEALTEIESFNRNLIENLPNYIGVGGSDGKILYMNLPAMNVLGYTMEEIIGTSVLTYVAEEYHDDVISRMADRHKGGEITPYEIDILSRDGRRISVIVKGTSIQYRDAPATLLVLTDITERKRAERILRDVIAKNPMSIQIVDKEGFTLNVNSAHTSLFGSVPPSDFSIFNDSQLKQLGFGELIERIKNGEVVTIPDTYYNAHDSVPESPDIPVWVRTVVFPLKDNYGKPEQFVFMHEDITERKRAEEELRESKALVDAVVENVPLMIFLKEATDLRFVIFNRAGEELLGYDRKALLGKNNLDLFPPEQAAHFMTKDREVLDGELSMLDIPEESILTAKKGLRLLHTRKVCIRAADGTTKFLLGISEDITDRKQVESTLALTARKLTLMNDVTYQYIQNKVTALRGYVELSKDTKTDAERISFIEKQEHILADIHQLIKNTREYQEIGLLLPQWIPVEQSIRIAVSLVSPKQNVPIGTTLHGLELYTDPLIEKIFANLIENAVTHGKTTTRIRFSCEEKTDWLILTCEDDGVGISPKDKAHLFDRSVGEHIHFGLFFIRECLLLSGMMIAETGESGKGARFEITVPKGTYRFGKPEG